jgi:WD40 repeat protein
MDAYEIVGHLGDIRSARFSPSGSWLFVVTNDDTLRVWYLDSVGAWNQTNIRCGIVDNILITADGSRLLMLTKYGEVVLWDISWLSGNAQRNAAAGSDPRPRLELLIDAACSASLGGTERIVADADGKEIRRESVRRLTGAGTDAAPILRGREGEDVCAWQPSLLDRWLTWAFRDLWRWRGSATPPPS